MTSGVKHPAKFSDPILRVVDGWVRMEAFWLPKRLRRLRILDPFAGTGLVHQLPGLTFGVELEPEWATMHPRTQVGNALALPWKRNSFDVIVTSPCYGNRFADSHNAQDGSLRRSYTHDLGRKLHPDNAGQLHWGDEYRRFHREAWREAARVLRPGGLFILNVSDHIRGGKRVPVSAWHVTTLEAMGLEVFAHRDVATRRMRQGENHLARVDCEHVIALRNAS